LAQSGQSVSNAEKPGDGIWDRQQGEYIATHTAKEKLKTGYSASKLEQLPDFCGCKTVQNS
jgi:hypothetical protein